MRDHNSIERAASMDDDFRYCTNCGQSFSPKEAKLYKDHVAMCNQMPFSRYKRPKVIKKIRRW